MKYENIVEGKFINRPNRFIAYVEVADRMETVHVKNTGRCRELLLPGNTVGIQRSDNEARKTKYDLMSAASDVYKRQVWKFQNRFLHGKGCKEISHGGKRLYT